MRIRSASKDENCRSDRRRVRACSKSSRRVAGVWHRPWRASLADGTPCTEVFHARVKRCAGARFFFQTCAGLRAGRGVNARGKRGVSRLCRYRPSLSNRSNRWGQPWQHQAIHTWWFCTHAADSARPRGDYLGSKGNQTGIEHRRRHHYLSVGAVRVFKDCVTNPAAGSLPRPILHDLPSA